MYFLNEPRPRRPYEKKTINKGGALIFGLGLGALAATVAILVGITLPYLSHRLENLPYYARTYYRKLIPHPEYLPAPAPTAIVAATSSPAEIEPAQPTPLPTLASDVAPGEAMPAALNVAGDNLTLPTPALSQNLLAPHRAQVQLGGFNHQWQTWNNCGPATITMNMSYFGHSETQVEAAQFLKPNKDDKNVSPHELAAYARTTGLEAIVRQGGTIDQLKTFLSNNFPVLAETWLIHDGDGLGHYRLLTGYDEATNQFNTYDSLNGPNFKVDIGQFDLDWRVFNRLYVVVFPPEQADIVSAIIGDKLDDRVMYEHLVAEAQAEIEANPSDAIAYFNQGDALTRLQRFDEAVIAFDKARQLGLHWRRLWYQFTPFEAYYAVGRYQDVLDLAEATLKGTGGLEEAYYYHGLALHATGQAGAAEDFQAALQYNPHFTPAANALNALSN